MGGEHIVIRPVVITHLVLVSDVGHVHGLVDVSNVLPHVHDPIAQDRLADVANLDKVVVGWADIEIDIDTSADWLAFVNNSGASRRQGRPADVITAGTPGNPGRTPVEIAAGKPDPAVISQAGPPSIVIGRPAEVFIRDPRPTDVSVGPVA